jgi:hypothetical protein
MELSVYPFHQAVPTAFVHKVLVVHVVKPDPHVRQTHVKMEETVCLLGSDIGAIVQLVSLDIIARIVCLFHNEMLILHSNAD